MKEKTIRKQAIFSPSLTRAWKLHIFTANETITNLTKYELTQEKSDLLRAGLNFSIQIKFENPKSSLPLKKLFVQFLTTLNPSKPKVGSKRISRTLLILIFTTTNLLHLHYVNIASYETLGRIKILLYENSIKEMELSS